MTERKDGLYDELITKAIKEELREFEHVRREYIENEKLRGYLVRLVSEAVDDSMSKLSSDEQRIELANLILKAANSDDRIVEVGKAERLIALVRKTTAGTRWIEASPTTPLSQLGLITNSDYRLNMSSELKLELRSSNQVDILMSFVKKKGIAIIAEELAGLQKRGVPVRLLTTVYTGATEKNALDYLVNEFGVTVKINYNADQSHLHAKAWLFKRDTGYSTAYIGSSNLSGTALTDGLEWNVRLSQISSPVLIDNFQRVFDSYWASEDIFELYNSELDGSKLAEALEFARSKFSGARSDSLPMLFMPNIDVLPREHQRKMLEDIQTQRVIFGRHRNLVVAATGTGKTVLAALDYQRMQEHLGRKPSLLFIAHRQEILDQSLATFRAVLKDWQFGEKFIGGNKPREWRHVFASVQSLASLGIENIDPTQFDYVVIDEFHHASAKTYTNVVDHLKPKELLALTATPERGDGKRVQDEFFEGVIASELRLWDALDRQLLAPFDYFGVADETDFTDIEWTGARYSTKELESRVIRNELRDKLVLNQIQKHVDDPHTMKALVFCVGVDHAEYVAKLLEDRGLNTKALTAKSLDSERAKAITDLGSGTLNAIVTVDLFNEGVDIPEVDTIIMLRPTESSVVFLQQLGRGLRKSPAKESVTVLDFIGAHRKEFRMDKKYEALTGLLPGQLRDQIELGFPNLPGGMSINLDAKASEHVLENIKSQLNYSNQRLVSLAQSSDTKSLRTFISKSGLDLRTLYTKTSWLELKIKAGLVDPDTLPEGSIALSNKSSKFLHIDDYPRVAAYKAIIEGSPLADISAAESEAWKSMLFWSLFPDAKLVGGITATSLDQAFDSIREHKDVVEEWLEILELIEQEATAPVNKIDFKVKKLPLLAHASYSRDEILGAVGWAHLEKGPEKKIRKSMGHQVGVSYVEELDMDVFFINLSKDAKKFSESTRYKDYAISKTLFNWESQNKDSENSRDGKRYINQINTKHDVLLCVREKSDGSAFKVLGLADYEDHSGSRPLEIRWKLRVPLDVATYDLAAAFKVS